MILTNLIVPTIYMLLFPFNFLGEISLGISIGQIFLGSLQVVKKKNSMKMVQVVEADCFIINPRFCLPRAPGEDIPNKKLPPTIRKKFRNIKTVGKNILLKGTFQGYVGEILDYFNGMFCCGKYYAVIGRSRVPPLSLTLDSAVDYNQCKPLKVTFNPKKNINNKHNINHDKP